ncbi:MAG: hypothetical protein IH594_06890 [Bacteroidales bacterium]|nr:hypothetical protein [Bacteroidales bacterium]
MAELTDKQILRIKNWVDDHNLTIDELKNELIDHIACEVELKINEGSDFDESFKQIIVYIPGGQLQKIEEASLYLVNLKFRRMKKLTVLSGLMVLATFFLTFLTRILQPKLMDEFLLAGMLILSIVFIPLFFISNYRAQKEEKHKILHILGFAGSFLVAFSAVLSYFEIRLSGISILLGLVFLLLGFFPLYLISFSKSAYLPLGRATLLLFLFVSILSVGFFNVTISKDLVDYWTQQGEELAAGNEVLSKISKKNLAAEDTSIRGEMEIEKIHLASDRLVEEIKNMHLTYIKSIDPGYRENDRFFKGRDLNRTGNRLSNSEHANFTLKEIRKYEELLREQLSKNNEKEITEIDRLLSWKDSGRQNTEEVLKYLFFYYPAIVNSVIIRSMESSVRLSEIKATNYLMHQHNEKTN